VVEREIKLEFASVEAARTAIGALGLPPLRERRLQDDVLYDTMEGTLRTRGCTLRLRRDAGTGIVTFKGPVEPGVMKVRPEIETTTGDATRMHAIFEALGYRVAFRYQKYCEEYGDASCVAAIDETPVGVFVELEGDAVRISTLAAAMGFGPAQYLTASYFSLHQARGPARGLGPHMLFPA
jgi:adenylate cyclase, class 2